MRLFAALSGAPVDQGSGPQGGKMVLTVGVDDCPGFSVRLVVPDPGLAAQNMCLQRLAFRYQAPRAGPI